MLSPVVFSSERKNVALKNASSAECRAVSLKAGERLKWT